MTNNSNVALSVNFEPKLGDFGLARLVDHEKGTQTTILAGTMGYMAPECFTSGKASKESDIYSFGVVALEIACGRRVVEPGLGENQIRLVDWVRDLNAKGKLIKAADFKLRGEFDKQEMERLMIVGLWCVDPDRACRPSVRQLTNVLHNSEAVLPVLPLQMPVPSFLAPAPTAFSLSFRMQSYNNPIHNSGHTYITDSSKQTLSSGASSPSATILLDTR